MYTVDTQQCMLSQHFYAPYVASLFKFLCNFGPVMAVMADTSSH